MLKMLKNFRDQEDGAITVDWVVLTAGIVGLGFAIVVGIGTTATQQSNSVGSYVGNMSIATY